MLSGHDVDDDDFTCSNAVVAAATKEATNLSDKEREIILAVLGRDELLRRDQQHRISHLKAELQNLRRKGALRPSTDWEGTGPDPDRSCGRCRVELGRVINRGAYCRACRLKVCKSCREYSFRATDWVCTVCHKHMEIQAASGEWMNEFVRRPSRRRDNKIYIPAADIIKRTIRRSWTISNPTPRWNVLRGSPELRPYNSLPRGQDINNYPSLALHHNLKNLDQSAGSLMSKEHSPCRRTQSEDVYSEQVVVPLLNRTAAGANGDNREASVKRVNRINPLMRLAETRQKSGNKGTSPRRKIVKGGDSAEKADGKDNNNDGEGTTVVDKHVTFDKTLPANDGISTETGRKVLSSSNEGITKVEHRQKEQSLDVGENCEEVTTAAEIHCAKEETAPIELCDIEPLSGTVFRKVTVRRRRQDMRKMPAVDTDDVSITEAHSSPMLASKNGSKSATPSPVAPSSRRGTGSVSSQDWSNISADDDIITIHQTRSSLSSLGLRSDSMASVYSGAGEGRYGTVAVRGQVEFGLQYNYKAGALEILIKQCKDLAPVDVKRNRSDPYVKVYLLPDKSKSGKRKTKVKKHTLNPVFEECLKFHISLNGLETRTLWLTVWHSDMFGRNDFLGEVMMTLENKVFDDPTPIWYNLQERTEPFDDMLSFKGDIIVCLKFLPPDITLHKKGKRSRGTLHVLVKEAKSLTAVKANGTSDPFCKSYLLPDKGRSSKQKTPVAKRTVNPVWNHTFVYDDVTLQELAERCLELTVWDHDRLASNEFLGGVRFSLGTGKHYGKPVDWMDATGKEHSLWKSMLERPNFWVEGCLSLRPTLDGRT